MVAAVGLAHLFPLVPLDLRRALRLLHDGMSSALNLRRVECRRDLAHAHDCEGGLGGPHIACANNRSCTGG